MHTRTLGALALVNLLLTALWLALLIASMASTGPVQTFEQALAAVAAPDGLFYLNYANASLITLVATLLFTGLHVYLRPRAAGWSTLGVVFLPAYSLLNLFVYFSQITIVPRLLALQTMPGYGAAAGLLLGQMTQSWPGSTVYVLNNLAYAILGIPSIIFGVLLARDAGAVAWAGGLLAASGTASILGLLGIILGSGLLSTGSVAGGVLYLLALIPLSMAFLRRPGTKLQATAIEP